MKVEVDQKVVKRGGNRENWWNRVREESSDKRGNSGEMKQEQKENTEETEEEKQETEEKSKYRIWAIRGGNRVEETGKRGEETGNRGK